MLHPKLKEAKLKSKAIEKRSLCVTEYGHLLTEERDADGRSYLEQGILSGYLVTWGRKNSHKEKFLRGVFDRSIQENGPQSKAKYKMKLNAYHNREKLIEVFDILENREYGLYFRTPPVDETLSYMPDIMKHVRSGRLNNYSIEFLPIWEEGKVEWDDVDESIVYKEAQLFGAGLVSTPSDMGTYNERSAEAIESLDEEIERFIRNSIRGEYRIEARELFARQKSLIDFNTSPEELAKALTKVEPIQERSALQTINFLTENFSL